MNAKIELRVTEGTRNVVSELFCTINCVLITSVLLKPPKICIVYYDISLRTFGIISGEISKQYCKTCSFA